MKKIILTIFIIISLIQIENTFASSWIIMRTTEKVPWITCNPVPVPTEQQNEVWSKYYPDLYDCEVKKWTSQIVEMLWNMIKYFTYIASLSGVLFIIYNWILYSMWWADQSLKDDSKKRIIWTLIWLILLLLSGPILQLIAPWIYK